MSDMTDTFFKTIRVDGGSFHDPDFIYEVGRTVRRRNTGTPVLCTDTVLHAARTAPLAARYSRWPYRLIQVAGRPVVEDDEKVGFLQITAVAERDVAECFGPNGSAVLAVVRRCESLTVEEVKALDAAWKNRCMGRAWGAAMIATLADARALAWDIARYATLAATLTTTLNAARAAALAAIVADLVGQYGYTQEHHDLLVGPWESVVGVYPNE